MTRISERDQNKLFNVDQMHRIAQVGDIDTTAGNFSVKMSLKYAEILKSSRWSVYFLLYSFMTEFPNIETSPKICFAHHWTGFYMIGTSVLKGLKIDPSQVPVNSVTDILKKLH